RIGTQDGVATRAEAGDRIKAGGGNVGLREDGHRAAVDVEQEWIALAWFVIRGIGEQAFDVEAVFRLPADDFGLAERQLGQLRVDLTDGERFEVAGAREMSLWDIPQRLPAE